MFVQLEGGLPYLVDYKVVEKTNWIYYLLLLAEGWLFYLPRYFPKDRDLWVDVKKQKILYKADLLNGNGLKLYLSIN